MIFADQSLNISKDKNRTVDEWASRPAGTTKRTTLSMRSKSVFAILSGLLLVGYPAFGQTLIETMEMGCGEEIKTYCSTVTPGKGRIMLCLAAHEDKISDECKWAMYDVHVRLTKAVQMTQNLGEQCAIDIERHCAGIPPGEGRILLCLYDTDETLTADCDKALVDAELK